jgi:hypothetical protein
MKKVFLLILFFISVSCFGQKLHKYDAINNEMLTLNPTIFDPHLDTTISYIEFFQDSLSNEYGPHKKVFAAIDINDTIEKIYAIGTIRDYRINKKEISVIIIRHHDNGSVSTIKYRSKIDKLLWYKEYQDARYLINVDIYYQSEDGEEIHLN